MDVAGIIEKFGRAKNRLVLLDYDGTLVNLASQPEGAIPSEETLNVLESLLLIPNTTVFIITGRSYTDIDGLLNNPELNIIAEHGGNFPIHELGKEKVLKIMYDIQNEYAGVFVEEKKFSLAWHFRNAVFGTTGSRKLLQLLEPLAEKYHLKILEGNKVIEVMNKESGKGKAVKKIIHEKKYDFILCIGDDVTDEEMFEELNSHSNAITIKVGDGRTIAREKISAPDDVIKLLNQL